MPSIFLTFSTQLVNLICILKQFLPRRTFHFETTGSVISRANERDEKLRQPLPGRLLSSHMLMYVSYVMYVVLALVIFFGISILGVSRGMSFMLLFPYPGSILRTIDCYKKGAVPVWYMINPPTVPSRRELMDCDTNGIYRPRIEKRNVPEDKISWKDMVEVAIILCYGCF